MRTALAMSPQPDRLARVMATAGMRHGDEAEGTLRNVRVVKKREGGIFSPALAELYFCPVQGIADLKILAQGDGGTLPETAVRIEGKGIRDLFPQEGRYDLVKAGFHSNGSLIVKITDETRAIYRGAPHSMVDVPEYVEDVSG